MQTGCGFKALEYLDDKARPCSMSHCVLARQDALSDSEGSQPIVKRPELTNSEGECKAHSKPGDDVEQLREIWCKRLSRFRCDCCSRQRGARSEGCFPYFRSVGLNDLVNFHSHFQSMHKLDQDRLAAELA